MLNRETQSILNTAEQAVTRLVEACRKDRPLYSQATKEVAQASRNGKWLLNAITQLKGQLKRRDSAAS